MLYRLFAAFAFICLHSAGALAQNKVPAEQVKQVKGIFEKVLVAIAHEAADKLVELDSTIKEKEEALHSIEAEGDLHALLSSVPGVKRNKTILETSFGKRAIQGSDIKADSVTIANINQALVNELAALHKPKLSGEAKSRLAAPFNDLLSTAVKNARSAINSTTPETSAVTDAGDVQKDKQEQGGDPGKDAAAGKTPPGTADTLDNKQHTDGNDAPDIFPIAAGVLGLLAVVMGAILLITRRRNTQSVQSLKELLEEKNTQLADKNNQLQGLAVALNNEQQKANALARQSEAVHRPAAAPVTGQQPTVIWQNNAGSGDQYFFAEAMVTAGPRKNFGQDAVEGDYGLGEDVAGFILRQDKAFFWVLDGTSDSDQLTKPLTTSDARQEEIFSSRLLAQSIGWGLQQVIQHLPAQFSAQELLKAAIQNTERDWQAKITGVLQAAPDSIVQALETRNGVLQCSTTVIFGILDLKGRLDVCRVGDSKLITWPGKNDFPKSTGRQFVTLQQKDTDVSLSFNDFTDLRSQHFQLEGIRTLIAMTDGVSPQMETWLQNSALDFSDRKTREIIAHFKQKTYDDKAMCIIQIKG